MYQACYMQDGKLSQTGILSLLICIKSKFRIRMKRPSQNSSLYRELVFAMKFQALNTPLFNVSFHLGSVSSTPAENAIAQVYPLNTILIKLRHGNVSWSLYFFSLSSLFSSLAPTSSAAALAILCFLTVFHSSENVPRAARHVGIKPTKNTVRSASL